MVGRRMRNVPVRVLVLRVMVVAMEDQFRQRLQDAIQMRRRGEVDGNIIEVECEHSSNNETNPPSRRSRREAAVVMLARIHKVRMETIGIPMPESITYFSSAPCESNGRFCSSHS